MKFFRQVLILCVVLVVSYFTSMYFGDVYREVFPDVFGGDSFIVSTRGASAILGLFLSYIFFLSLFFTAFGDEKKYWWIGILLIPAAIFEIYFDAAHLYFPILLVLLGWLIGFGISKIFRFNLKKFLG